MRAVPLIAFVLIVITTVSMARADYIVNVSNDAVAVTISGDVMQGVPNSSANYTADIFTKFPVFQVQNSSVVATYLETAVRKLTPVASVSQIFFAASSNGTVVHYDLKFDIEGVSRDQGTAKWVDLTWRSFQIAEDFKIGNVTVNGAVPDYLGSQIAALAKLSASTGPPLVERRFWYLNGGFLPPDLVATTASTLLLLNFTTLSKPLEAWAATPDFAHQSFHYQMNTGFNLTQITQVSEPEITNFARDVVYKVKAVIDSPWGTTESGNSVVFEGSGSLAMWIMIGSVSCLVVLAMAAFFFERRLRLTYRSPRRDTNLRRPTR